MKIGKLSVISKENIPETKLRGFEAKMQSIRVHDELVKRVGSHMVGIKAMAFISLQKVLAL